MNAKAKTQLGCDILTKAGRGRHHSPLLNTKGRNKSFRNLRGRVVWGNSPLFVQPILLPCQASCAHPPGEKASKKEWDGRRKKRWGEKKGRKIVKHGKEKVTKLTTCSSHILGSVFWLYTIRERCHVWKPRKQRKERHTVSKNRRNADARICKRKSQINLAYELESKRTVSKVQSA